MVMKVAFWGVLAVGFVACSVWGIGPVLARMDGNWLSAPMLVGCAAGLAIIALAVMFATGNRPAVFGDDAAMVAALAVLVGVKVVVAAMATGGVR